MENPTFYITATIDNIAYNVKSGFIRFELTNVVLTNPKREKYDGLVNFSVHLKDKRDVDGDICFSDNCVSDTLNVGDNVQFKITKCRDMFKYHYEITKVVHNSKNCGQYQQQGSDDTNIHILSFILDNVSKASSS